MRGLGPIIFSILIGTGYVETLNAQGTPASLPASQPARASQKTRPDGTLLRGAKLSNKTSFSVSKAVKDADDLKGKEVKIAGKIKSVCQKKGCWMVIADEKTDASIRVTFKDYAFFVPKDVSGRKAKIEGVLSVKTLDIPTAQHYADDAAHASGKKPKKITKTTKEISLVAAGVELYPSKKK